MVLNWRWIFFALYVSLVFVLPLSILGNAWGLAIGSSLAIVTLVSLRWNGTKFLSEKMNLLPFPDSRPEVAHMVKEYCRRLSIPTPRLKLLDSPALNIGVFGFSNDDAVLVLTRGVLSLPREQLSALLARATGALWHSDFRVETWLARYLAIFSKQTEKTLAKRFYSTKVFLKQSLLYPLTVVPSFILRGTTEAEELDLKAAKLCQNPRGLSEALRTMEASRERVPLRISFAFSRLFFVAPPLQEPLFHFLSSRSANGRIKNLESFSRTVNPV